MQQAPENSVKVKLDVFEGPFDLLFHLIEKHEIDIYHIPIAQLTDQYLDYLGNITQNQMEDLSKFMVMAATLIEIKSKMLLPKIQNKTEESDDPRAELVQKLVEYKTFKEISEVLKENYQLHQYFVFREPEPDLAKKFSSTPKIEDVLAEVTVDKLYDLFLDLLNRRELKTDKVRSGFNSVALDTYKVSNKIEYISKLLTLNPSVKFTEIFNPDSHRMEKVVTFLALLELIKSKHVTITQEGIFGEILIKKV